MIRLKKQNRELEEMLIQEFSSLSNLSDHFSTRHFQDRRKGIIKCEIVNKRSNTASNRYIQPKEQPFYSEAKGICSNCLNFKDCRLPKNPAGVWHCEEYV
jgi:hypothetical protein